MTTTDTNITEVKAVLDNANWSCETNHRFGSDDEKACAWLSTQKFSVNKIKSYMNFAQGETPESLAMSISDLLAYDRIASRFNWVIGDTTSFIID